MTPTAPPVFALAVGAHPDDVELACGGTLARLVDAGLRVGICHLTRGEAGTRGDAATRRQEAEAAARVLGVHELRFLDCGDAGLRTGAPEEDALIDVFRELRPRLVLAHGAPDRHPDHERAGRLARDALFYARLAKRAAGRGLPAHRGAVLWRFQIHEAAPAPTVVVDVAATFERKLAALRCYRSQLAVDGATPGADPRATVASGGGSSPATWVSTPAFWAGVEARARRAGALVEARLGEAFVADAPLAVAPERLFPSEDPSW